LSFYAELKRRNVFRVAAAYIVVAWLLIQVAETIFPLFRFDDTPARIVVITLAILFIPTVVAAWVFELTPEGLKRDDEVDRGQPITMRTGKRLDQIIMVVLALALGYFAFDKFVLDPARDAEIAQTSAKAGAEQALQKARGTDFSSHSIAVLPFVNMSSDKEQEYFSEGLSEELLNLLAKIPELRVAARTSSFSYKGKDTKIAQIGEELNVAHVLEGSVRKSGNQIRITAQLIKTDNGFHVWSETYDRTLSDIFAMQDEIAASVVAALKVSILGAMPTQQETNPEVYALYLQGKFFNDRRSDESVQKALTALKQALAIDPNYAPAWVELNITYFSLGQNGTLSFAESARLARSAVDRALAIDSNLASAWAARAYLLRTFDQDWAGAQAAIERAIELEPNSPNVIGSAASIASTFGRLPEAIELFEKDVLLDPLNLTGLRALGRRYLRVGRIDDAFDTFDRVLAIKPDYRGMNNLLIRAYMMRGDLENALLKIEENPDSFIYRHAKASVFYQMGKETEAQTLINELLETSADEVPRFMAELYAWRGEGDSAFEWLEIAYEQDRASPGSFLGNLWWRKLTGDPRYAAFVEKIGLLEEWKAMPPEHGGPPKP
jgi:TolB-like protein/Tfp pilus assembly protein PilF